MDNRSLIARIQKLLALSTARGATEGEAAVASSKAQELLAEHNLTLAEVTDQPAETRKKAAHDAAAMYRYQRSLMKALARNNFCMHFLSEVWSDDPRGRRENLEGKRGRYVKRHMLLGRQVNVTVTKLTYDYLIATMDRMLPWQGMDKRGKDALLWLTGCADRLIERLGQRRREMEAASQAKKDVAAPTPGAGFTMGSALVVLTDVYGSEEELNRDALYGLKPGTTAQQRRERAAKEQEIEAEMARLVAEGVDRSDAWYLAHGWTIPPKTEEKEETEAQKRRREEREERSNDRYWERWQRQQNRLNQHKSTAAYLAGRETGEKIGLDQQIDKKERRAIR